MPDARHPAHTYTAVVERCPDTGFYVGYVPGFRGAHSQGETIEELSENLKEVITMLLDDGEPQMEAEYIGTRTIVVTRAPRAARTQAARPLYLSTAAEMSHLSFCAASRGTSA